MDRVSPRPAIWDLQWAHIPKQGKDRIETPPIVLGEWGGEYQGATPSVLCHRAPPGASYLGALLIWCAVCAPGKYQGLDKFWQNKMAAFLADPLNRIAGSFYW